MKKIIRLRPPWYESLAREQVWGAMDKAGWTGADEYGWRSAVQWDHLSKQYDALFFAVCRLFGHTMETDSDLPELAVCKVCGRCNQEECCEL